nr:lipid II flippase MurJ [Yimella sp. cx-51]
MGPPAVNTTRLQTIAGAASAIAVVTLASRLVGFGRWLVFSREVGGTCVGQAYATANQLPNILYEVAAGGALAAVVVPLVAGAVERGDQRTADRVASVLLTWAVAVLLPLSVLLALLAGPLARLMTGDASRGCSGIAGLTSMMLLVFAPQVLLYGVGVVLTGVLQAHRRFVAAAVAPLLSSLVVIAAYLLYGRLADSARFDRSGVNPGQSGLDAERWVLAGGTTLGVVALSLPLLLPVVRAGVRLRPALRLPAGLGARAAGLAGAGLAALLAQQFAVLVTINLANDKGATGAINVYNYVQAIYVLPYALLAVPIATAAFPRLAGDDGDRVLARVMPLVGAAGVLGAAVLVAVAAPTGDFFTHLDARPAAMTALTPALLAYAPGLLGFSLVALLSRALYVRGRALLAGGCVATGWLLAALIPLLLLGGVTGDSSRTLVVLGLASSIGMSVSALLLALMVRGAWPEARLGSAVRSWVRALLAATVAAVGGAGAAWLLGSATGSLLTSALVAVAAAVVTVAIFGVIVRVIDKQAVQGLIESQRKSRS